MHRLCLSVLLAAVSLAAAPVRAETFSVCTVMPSRDGFVALRARPARDAPVVAQMKPGQIAVIDVKNQKLVKSGNWLSISWFPGEEMPNPGDPGYDKVKRGWASNELIDECG